MVIYGGELQVINLNLSTPDFDSPLMRSLAIPRRQQLQPRVLDVRAPRPDWGAGLAIMCSPTESSWPSTSRKLGTPTASG